MGAQDIILDAIDELTYRNYRWNREQAPEILPASWKKIYGPNADAYEARYQAEVNAYAEKRIREDIERHYGNPA